jgi:ATP-dependent helicase/nuclease subunit B
MVAIIRKLILSPDAFASKRIRAILAERYLGFGVKVVTPNELTDELRLAYLLSEVEDEWLEKLSLGMEGMPSAFWTKSFDVDPVGTSSAIADALDHVLRSGAAEGAWESPNLPARANNTLEDLKELWKNAGQPLPSDLTVIKKIEARSDSGIYSFAIHFVEDWPRLDIQIKKLINVLNAASGSLDDELQKVVREVSQPPSVSPRSSVPHRLAATCFGISSEAIGHSEELSFLTARDPLEEIECVIGSIQKLLSDCASCEDIGVLLPDDRYYHRAFADAVSFANLHAAGLSNEYVLRDLGGEVVRSLLLIARGPVPKMAFAALLASPIAPWRQSVGNRLASYVMSGRFTLRTLREMTADEEKSLMAVQRLRDNKIPVSEVIEGFARGVENTSHSMRLRSLGKSISEHETGSGDIDYDLLLEFVGHAKETLEQTTVFPQNGIRVFSENQEPWAEVKHIFVLGFNGGHFPSLPGTSPVFHDSEKQSINDELRWDLPTAEKILGIRRSRFQRQIGAASETVTFFASARSTDGSPIQLSETATFIAGLLGTEPEELFIPVQKHGGRLPQADDVEPVSMRQLASKDLDLTRDLLVLRNDEDGSPTPESPSSLETLLVSPLSWLLGRLDALPDPWSADALDARLQGNIAHGVFEYLFKTDGQLIERDLVEAAVDEALAEVIRQQAPLLSTAHWKVERNSLRSTLIQAVKNWREVLEVLDAKVVGVEASLKGEFSGIPIRGFSDEVVQLPSGKLAVVDFKKSSSPKRRERMELGFDCQVSLYEKMINDNPDKLGVESSSESPGIIYYTLNDQRVITDDRTGLPNTVPGLIVISNDVSVNALNEIRDQIKKLKRGIVEMNHEGDAVSFAKEKALPGFALEATPLIKMFAHSDPMEREQ